MRNLIRTAVVATAVVTVTTLGPVPSNAASAGPAVVPTVVTRHPDGWWCRLTHLC